MQRKMRPMNPYVAGSLAGLLSVASTWLSGKYFGASTSFVRSAGFVEKTLASEHFSTVGYLVKNAPKIDWQLMFVAGIFLGALVSSSFGYLSISIGSRFLGRSLRETHFPPGYNSFLWRYCRYVWGPTG